MSDQTPDNDDVAGHVSMKDTIRDEPGGRRVASATDDDVRGHVRTRNVADPADPADGIVAKATEDDDDVEGHVKSL